MQNFKTIPAPDLKVAIMCYKAKLFVLWKRQRLTWAQAHAHGGCGGDGGGETVVLAVPCGNCLLVLWRRQRLTWAQAHAHGGCGGDGGGERVVPAVPGVVVVGGGGGAGGSI